MMANFSDSALNKVRHWGLGTLLCLTWLGGNVPAPAGANETQVVAVTEGTNLAATVDPRGQFLIIDLAGQLWQLPISGGAASALTPLGEEARNPRMAPDGKSVVYQGYANGQWDIWLLELSSGKRRALTTGGYDHREPDFHPSGEYVAFSSDRSGSYQIWELALADGGLRQLTDHAGDFAYPSYSHRGDRLAFVSRKRGGTTLLVVGRTGGSARVLLSRRGQILAPAWRRGDGVLSFVVEGRGESRLEMLLLGPDPVTKPLTEPGQSDVFGFRANWLADDSFIYTADGKIWRQGLGLEPRRQIPLFAALTVTKPVYQRKIRRFDDPSPQPVRGIRAPRVSPDGKRIAFSALGDLWLLEENGKLRQLTDDPWTDIDPAFHPNGGRIYFASERGGRFALWEIETKTGATAPLVSGERDLYAPAVSPDAKRVAYLESLSGGWGRSRLKVLDLETQATRDIGSDLFSPSKPRWTPEGDIALTTVRPFAGIYREGTNGLLTVDPETGESSWQAPPDGRQPTPRAYAEVGFSERDDLRVVVSEGRLHVSRSGSAFETAGAEGAASPSVDRQGRITYLAHDELRRFDPKTGTDARLPMPLQFEVDSGEQEWVLQVGRLFDGVGTRYRHHQDIHIRGQRIVAVVARGLLPYPERVVDARNWTVFPGLADMHAHMTALNGERLGRIWLAYGVTTVREPGADPYDALERREAWDSGRRAGPRLFLTGSLLDGNRIYYAQATSAPNPAALDIELDRAERLGYDLIKTYVRLPDALQAHVIERAHAIGIPVSSHEIYPAAFYGADAVEHLGATSRRGYNPKVSASGKSYDDVRQTIIGSGMTFTPTLALIGGFAELAAEDSSWLNDRVFGRLFRTEEQEALRPMLRFFGSGPALSRQTEPRLKTIAELIRAGGRVTAGTDSPFIPFGLALHAELAVLVKAGLSPDQVLRLATAEAALALGQSTQMGTLEPGRLADMVLVAGDPLDDIGAARRIEAVVRGGRLYSLETLLDGPDETPLSASDSSVSAIREVENSAQ